MAAHQHRFVPLQILDADWRREAWKRWLRSRLAMDQEAAGAAAGPRTATIAPPPPVAPCGESTAADAALPERRTDGRVRLDALLERLMALEETIDTLNTRFSHKMMQERRQEQRIMERIESTFEKFERQSIALESACTTLERVEQRVDRLERCLRAVGGFGPDISEARRSPSKFEVDDSAELEDTFASYSRRIRSTPPEALDYLDANAHSSSSIRGNLSEMSLATVLAMLELERRTGMLKVNSNQGQTITATLRKGTIVGAKVQDQEVEPVEGVRAALHFTGGSFSFSQSHVEVASGPPRSIGSVLLEATSRNDEATRAG